MQKRYLLVESEPAPEGAAAESATGAVTVLRGAMLQQYDCRPSASQRGKEVHRLAAERGKAQHDGQAVRGRRRWRHADSTPSMTRRERDLFAAYAATHGPDKARWPRGARRHYEKRARLLREAVREILS